jgi:hypothetical protein
MLESPMQNEKVQLWALGIPGYNCKIENISGVQIACAVLLFKSPPCTEYKEADGDLIFVKHIVLQRSLFQLPAIFF